MGPWSEKKQLERARSVVRLLQKENLSPWAEQFWLKTVKSLARNEATYNARVYEIYKAHKQWENPFDE
jgi:hypothetical protein